jgi:hypothetical protein
MMTGVIAIIVIMVAVVGSALSADIVFTPPKHVISDDSEQQDSAKNQQAELEKQQAAQQQQAELEKRQVELERRAAQKRQAELLNQQATKQQQAELETQQAAQQQHPGLERERAAEHQQAELERQQAELEKRQAELERRQFLLEKRRVQTLKAKLEKQQAEIEKQLTELEKKQAELNEQEASFASPNPTAATSLSCDAASQIIANLGFEKVKAELCTGDTYNFVAMRNGKSFSIEITAANGEVKNVPAEALVVVANQVRLPGHKCDKPSAIERDVFFSKPGLPVWLLTCGEDRYRVELIPHKQARVTQLN